MKRVDALLADARRRLGDPAEAEILLAHVLGRDRGWLYAWPEHPVDAATAARFRDLIEARRRGLPVARLTGRREFWSLPLEVDEHTLIPRPETEHLVECVLEHLPADRPCRVVDLGTGSGAIALALARERPAWRIAGCDRSLSALRRARANARRLGLRVDWVCGDWLEALHGPFDAIVANPPYLAADDPHLRRGDLRFEPRDALVSGEDGLHDLRRIARQARSRLRPGGLLAMEHGWRQGAAVRRLLDERGFADVATGRDLAGHERLTRGRRPD